MVLVFSSKKCDDIINCVCFLYNLSVRKLRSRYDYLYLYYFFLIVCINYFLYFFRSFYWVSVTDLNVNRDLSFDLRMYFSKVQFNLFSNLYPKLNNYSIFYHLRRKRKQRRSLFLVLAFDKHVCFKNIEREYSQIRYIYSRCL
jgi:hypothetical protein